MTPQSRAGFKLDGRLQADSTAVTLLGLCELRIMNDRRWPWLLLVPQRPGMRELHDLSPLDQAMMTFETNLVAKGLKELTGCAKINSGSLGNVVPQLHVHVVARNPGDGNWLGPVWGHGERQPYAAQDLIDFAAAIRSAL